MQGPKKKTISLPHHIPEIGRITSGSGMVPLETTSDGRFRSGENGVRSITATGDGKVEFISFGDHSLAFVNSAMGHPAYYPVHPVRLGRPVRYVLMDLDGTTVRSEHFWIRIIGLTTASLLGQRRFSLEEEDLPYVSGHSVSEHLQYCIRKYAPGASISEAFNHYFRHTRRELKNSLKDPGNSDFEPAPGVKEFLLTLKAHNIKIALVTSGLYEKAWPEIISAFKKMKLDDPVRFYDAIITAGVQPGRGQPGTLGELEPKPHPWLYSEAATIGLQVKKEEWGHVAGIDDSGAGICSIRLAGFSPVGLGDGNITASGTRALCSYFSESFEGILQYLLGNQ